MSAVTLEETAQPAQRGEREVQDDSRRRFSRAAIVGAIVGGVPYLWILWDEWTGTYSPTRRIQYFSSFYDEQARSIMHGHLWVPTGSIGIEGFIHNGRTYTYFGLLPSLLRIPILLVAPSETGHLTAPSMLVAWLFTALFSSLLIWRVRVLLRGTVAMGRAEATSMGVLMATIMGGSVLLFLAAAPWVYNEDLAWSVPVTIATLFVFLGILDRPSSGRVVAAGALVLAGVLGRPTPGLACVVGAILIAGWFALGRGGAENRRWALPMLVIGFIPFAVSVTVNWLKFGTLLNGLPLAHQVWTQLNAHRRAFLVATGGKGYSFHFLPTTLWAYFQPLGLRVQPTFPFLALPIQPPHIFGGYIVDVLYPTQSVPVSMPLLFLLSIWAVIAVFRRKPGRGATLIRIPIIVAAGATAVDFVLGYIAPRYLADFLPLLVLGSAVGTVGIWRRYDYRPKVIKRVVMTAFAALGIFSMVVNVALAVAPTTQWTTKQAADYVATTLSISNVTGHPLSKQIKQVSALPYWAPANDLYIVGNCEGLFLSSGIHLSTDPILQREHQNWVPVELGSGVENNMRITFHAPLSKLGTGIPILSVGPDTILVRSVGNGAVRFVLDDPRYPIVGPRVKPQLDRTYTLEIETDSIRHVIVATLGEFTDALAGVFSGAQPGTPVSIHSESALTVVRQPSLPPELSLCRRLLKDR